MPSKKQINKRILNRQRVRRIRGGFSWIDRRFVSDEWIDRLTRDEILLYFFLVCVGDRNGLSYYSAARIAGTLRTDREKIGVARDRLVQLGLLAFEQPLYQVLSLEGGEERRRSHAQILTNLVTAFSKRTEASRSD